MDQVRTAAAGLALLFILLPWMPVGPSGSMAGSQLAGHSLFNDAIGDWLRENPVGAFLFVVTPTLTIVLSFQAFVAIIRKRNPLYSHLVIVILPLLTLKFASHPMLDSSPNALFGVPIPQIGLLHLMVIHLGLLLYGIYLKYEPSLFRPKSSP